MCHPPVAETVATYVEQVKKLADQRREEAQTRARLLAANAYGLAADPTEPHASPSP